MKPDDLLHRLTVAVTLAPALYVPISGGSDSALTFWLLNRVAPGRVLGMFVRKSDDSIGLRERDWFESVGLIETVCSNPSSKPDREEHMWSLFLAYSLGRYTNEHELPAGWLAGSRNYTEEQMGTFSLASRVATLLPIVNLYKTQVLAMCKEVGVPDSIIESSRKADPDCGRPAEMAEVSLEKIDKFLGLPIECETWIPACKACNDTRRSTRGQQCTFCPLPCKECDGNRLQYHYSGYSHSTAYCGQPHCDCKCHGGKITVDPQIEYLRRIKTQNAFKRTLPVRV